MLVDLLLTLSIRFFLFDFVLFKSCREWLKGRHYVFLKLFNCTFCQGFWCGLAVSLCDHRVIIAWQHLQFAFISAFLSFTWTVVIFPFVKKFEDAHELPMT